MVPADSPGLRPIERVSRRRLLRITAWFFAVTSLASSAAAGQSSTDFEGWFANVSNYDGIVDRRGQSEVAVEVGIEANDGYFGFGPAAIRVSPGTTVTWTWSGNGGSHNVVHTDGAFESELTTQSGHTFSQPFEQAGVYQYFCTPHKTLGMKGAVVVGDVSVSESLSSAGDSEGGNENDGAGATRPMGGFFNLAQLSIQDALMMTLLGTSGLAIGFALLPDIGLFASTAARPASKTGYIIHRFNRFRNSWVFSVIIGWASFLAVLVALGILFVAIWHLGQGAVGFLVALAVIGVVVAWYIITNNR